MAPGLTSPSFNTTNASIRVYFLNTIVVQCMASESDLSVMPCVREGESKIPAQRYDVSFPLCSTNVQCLQEKIAFFFTLLSKRRDPSRNASGLATKITIPRVKPAYARLYVERAISKVHTAEVHVFLSFLPSE